jgi:DNA polymerase-3 subunit epsilon
MRVNNLPLADFRSIPQSSGVYLFYGNSGCLLYVGKSVALRSRIQSHFTISKTCPKEARLILQTVKIGWQETAGELGALLLEAKLIKQYQPLYNRMLRKKRILYGLKLNDSNLYNEMRLIRLAQIEITEFSKLYGLSRSKAQLLDQLYNLAKEYHLCTKLLGLEKSKGPCFNFQIKRCYGACQRIESHYLYNQRLMAAMHKLQIKTWPYQSYIIVKETAPAGNVMKDEFHIIHNWCHIRTINQLEETKQTITATQYEFDFDIYKILVRHILKYDASIEIIQPHFAMIG